MGKTPFVAMENGGIHGFKLMSIGLVVLASVALLQGVKTESVQTSFVQNLGTSYKGHCKCDACAEVYNDKCDDCATIVCFKNCFFKQSSSELKKSVYGRNDITKFLVPKDKLTCKSCLVSCLSDDLGVSTTEKHLRCEAVIVEWKREQLCLARNKHVPVFFKHVHKAGGVFFCNKIARPNAKCATNVNCVPGSTDRFCQLRRLTLLEQQKLSIDYPDLEFLSMESSLPSRWMWGTYAWVTMLRRPEDRTLSAFYWWLYALNEFDFPFKIINGVKRKFDYCENYSAPFPKSFPKSNQTRTMEILNYWLDIYPDNQMVRTFCSDETYDVPKGQLSQAHLNCAKRRLDYFGLVLIIERMEDSVEALETYLGWDNIHLDLNSTKDRENARQGTSGPTKALTELHQHPEILHKFGEMHLLDRKLYDYANSLLDSSLKAIGKF